MQRSILDGRSILIVEDDAFIVTDITQAFEATGAALTTTNTLKWSAPLNRSQAD
jgi:CheY-like chemotaxis protein